MAHSTNHTPTERPQQDLQERLLEGTRRYLYEQSGFTRREELPLRRFGDQFTSVMDDPEIIHLSYQVFLIIARAMVPGYTVTPALEGIIYRLITWVIGSPLLGIDPRKGILLLGKVGIGKSTLLRILRAFSKRIGATLPVYSGTSQRYDYKPFLWMQRHALDICDEYRSTGELSGLNAPILAIDDLGLDKPTSYFGNVTNPVASLISRRSDQNGDYLHLITTNLSRPQLAKLYGPRMESRLFGMNNVLILDGIDRRLGGFDDDLRPTPLRGLVAPPDSPSAAMAVAGNEGSKQR